MSVKMKIFLLILVIILCAIRWHDLKENSEPFNKGIERIEELVEIVTE